MPRKNDIDCPPYAPVLMESTRAIGYSIESAIADIIDNSIAAKATRVDIKFSAIGVPYISITDNGKGMTSKVLTEAMRYGTSSPTDEREESDLGRYGLGLKTASLSQCRKLTVVTKFDGELEGRCWDLDYILQTKSWSLINLTSEEINQLPNIESLENNETGTIVIWQNLDKIKLGGLTLEKSIESKMEDVKKHLELVFHRYLSGDGVPRFHITSNGVELVAFDPFFTSKSQPVMDDEKIDIPDRAGKVIIRPYILPHPSNLTKDELEKMGGKDGLRQLQGFYIYRNKRLLTWGTWFKLIRMDEFSKLARVRVDIPNSLDDLWTLDIKKSMAYPPEIVKTRLKQLVGQISNGSKRTWHFRQRKEISSNVVHVWQKNETREGYKYVINMDHPMLKSIDEKLDESTKKMLHAYLETIQNNILLNNLHDDMHSDAKIIQDKEDVEKERVLYMAKIIIKEAIRDDHIDETMKNFEIVEPFMDYYEEIKQIYSEVKING